MNKSIKRNQSAMAMRKTVMAKIRRNNRRAAIARKTGAFLALANVDYKAIQAK